MRLGGRRQDQNHDFSLRQKTVEFADGMNRRFGARGTGDAGQFNAKGRKHPLDLFADGAVTHQQHALAGEFFLHNGRMNGPCIAGHAGVLGVGFEAPLPLAGALHIEIKREILQHGQNGAEGPLGGGDVVRAAGVRDSDVRSGQRRNPLRAGHQRQNQAHTAQMGPDAHAPRRVGVGNPDVDVDFAVEIVGQGNQFDFRREITQQFSSQCGGVSDSQHEILEPEDSRLLTPMLYGKGGSAKNEILGKARGRGMRSERSHHANPAG